MRRKDPDVILAQKQSHLIERTALALAIKPLEASRLLQIDRQQSLRLNPLRYTNRSQLLRQLRELGWEGTPYPWLADGYTINKGLLQIRDSKLVRTGQVYIQNSASWLPIIALDPKPREKILDLCAAPGGKTAHIAAITNNQAELVVNDNSRPRLAKMKGNFDRLNVRPTQIILYDASHIVQKMEGQQFDKILLDAPCSGEGMMLLDRAKDFESWSVAHIRRLQHLQKRIITQAWQLLKPGGTLIYSTCTIAPEENEVVINHLLHKFEDAQLQPLKVTLPNHITAVSSWNDKPLSLEISKCLRLAPSLQTEAFFVAKLTKII